MIIALAGPSCAGKSTVSDAIFSLVSSSKIRLTIIHQDDFYKKDTFGATWDDLASLNLIDLKSAISKASAQSDAVLIEGTMALDILPADAYYAAIILSASFDICQNRRRLRNLASFKDQADDDPLGYFEEIAWPSYQASLSKFLRISKIPCLTIDVFEKSATEIAHEICIFCNLNKKLLA